MSQQKLVLRHLRRAREITIHALARGTKINTSKLSLGERGLAVFSDDEQDALAQFFGVPKDELLKPFDGEAVAS